MSRALACGVSIVDQPAICVVHVGREPCLCQGQCDGEVVWQTMGGQGSMAAQWAFLTFFGNAPGIPVDGTRGQPVEHTLLSCTDSTWLERKLVPGHQEQIDKDMLMVVPVVMRTRTNRSEDTSTRAVVLHSGFEQGDKLQSAAAGDHLVAGVQVVQS